MSAQRMQFLGTALIILLGIGLTGFHIVHWFLYVPVVALAVAGLTGICPSVIVFKKLGFS
ncbi:MAG: hypothetical protein H7837_11610 [Magnetococcus sp. MYC-9]